MVVVGGNVVVVVDVVVVVVVDVVVDVLVDDVEGVVVSGVGAGVAGGSGAVMVGRASVDVVEDPGALVSVLAVVVSTGIGEIVSSVESLLLVQPTVTTAKVANPAQAVTRRRCGRVALPRTIASR